MKAKVLGLLGVLTLCAVESSSAGTLFSFQGEIDFSQKRFVCALNFPSGVSESAVSPPPRSVVFNAQKISDKDYRFSLDIEHLRTPFFDLLSQIESSVELLAPQTPGKDGSVAAVRPPALRGEIRSRYSLIDYKPIRELSGQFDVTDGRFFLRALSFGNLLCEGSVDLVSPHKVDLTMSLNHVGMEDFLSFWMGGRKYDASGTVSGRISVLGTLERPVLKGALESRGGTIGTFVYDSIYLNAQGVYPELEVVNSTVSPRDGMSFVLDGPVDLSDGENFQKQITALTFSPLTSESPLGREWTIKRLKEKGSSSTQIKYLLRDGDRLPSSSSGPSGMVGFERTVEF